MLVDDFRHSRKFQEDVEAEGDFFVGQTGGFNDAASPGQVGPGEIPAQQDAELEMVRRNKIFGGLEGGGGVAGLNAGNRTGNVSKTFFM